MLSRAIMDTLIRRRKAHLDRLPFDRYKVRLARDLDDYEQAFRLVQVAYMYRGIAKIGPVALRMTEQHVLPEAHVLVAHEGDRMVGTMSLTLDSPAGLPLDRDYPEALAHLRQSDARLSEIGSFAVVQRCLGDGVAQLLSIAALRLAFALRSASHITIGIHPEAFPFYRAVWGFEELGRPRAHANLHASVVGAALERQRLRTHLCRHFPRRTSSGYSLDAHLDPSVPIPSCSLGEDGGQPRMPRSVFRRLFIEETNHLAGLDRRTLRYLRTQRSDQTLGAFAAHRRREENALEA